MEKVVEKNTEHISILYDINFQTNSYAAAAQRDTGTPGHVTAPAAPSPTSQSPPPAPTSAPAPAPTPDIGRTPVRWHSAKQSWSELCLAI